MSKVYALIEVDINEDTNLDSFVMASVKLKNLGIPSFLTHGVSKTFSQPKDGMLLIALYPKHPNTIFKSQLEDLKNKIFQSVDEHIDNKIDVLSLAIES